MVGAVARSTYEENVTPATEVPVVAPSTTGKKVTADTGDSSTSGKKVTPATVAPVVAPVALSTTELTVTTAIVVSVVAPSTT